MSLSSLIELHPSDADVKENLVNILTQRDTHISLQLVFGMMLSMGYHRVHGVIVAKHGVLTEGQPKMRIETGISPAGYHGILYKYSDWTDVLAFQKVTRELGYNSSYQVDTSVAHGRGFSRYGETFIERVRPKAEDINWNSPPVMTLARNLYLYGDELEDALSQLNLAHCRRLRYPPGGLPYAPESLE